MQNLHSIWWKLADSHGFGIWRKFTSRDLDQELILGLRPANERRRYFVTTSLIGWAQA